MTVAGNTSPTLTFPAGGLTTVTNSLQLAGRSSSFKLKLRSSAPGTRWQLSPPDGTTLGGSLDVQDGDSASSIHSGVSSTDSGNNVNWLFP